MFPVNQIPPKTMYVLEQCLEELNEENEGRLYNSL